MTDTPMNAEAAAYEAAVRRHLADLPAEVREDLLTDLETHLAEVAAELEPGTTLVDRLGAPESYARELREAAEVEGVPAGSAVRGKLDAAVGRVSGVADRFTVSAGVGNSADFWKSLKPAWWIVRGVAAAGLLFYLMMVFGLLTGVYQSMGAAVFTLVVLSLVFSWFSLRLGARSEQWVTPKRWAVAIGGTALVAFAAAGFFDVVGTTRVLVENSGYEYDEYGYVEDVYPFSEDGEPLTGVYLLDQYGEPIYIGNPSQCSILTGDPFGTEAPEFDGSTLTDDLYEDEHGYQYPLCAPGGNEPGDEATADPTASEAPSEPDAGGNENATTEEEPTTAEATAITPSESPTGN